MESQSVETLPERTQDLLKAVYFLERQHAAASYDAVGKWMKYDRQATETALSELSDQGLLVLVADGARLSEEGAAAACGIVRRHLLIETYLHQVLGVPVDQVHTEADKLEHAMSPEVAERIAEQLGHPRYGTTGSAIPAPDGSAAPDPGLPLVDFPVGSRVKLVRVRNMDPGAYRFLTSIGLRLQSVVTIIDIDRYGGPVTLDVGGVVQTLRPDTARVVFVEPV